MFYQNYNPTVIKLKKILYILIITTVLVAPITYWLITYWGVKFIPFPSIERFKYIYSQDKYLKIGTIINFTVYLIAIFKIITIKNLNTEIQTKTVSTSKLQTIENGKSWSKIYDTKKVNETITTKKQTENKEIPIQNITKQSTINSEEQEQELKNIYKQEIDTILTTIGYEAVPTCKINGITIDFISVADSDTLVIGIINTTQGEITINETENNTPNVQTWFTKDKKFTSPIYEITKAKTALQNLINEVLPNSNAINIYPIIVIPNAKIVNLYEIQNKLNDNNINITKLFTTSEFKGIKDILPNKEGKIVLESYKKFIYTIIKYFKQKLNNKV